MTAEPGIDEVAETLAKGHLLIEAALTGFIERRLVHGTHLADASLRFYQKSAIARALCRHQDESAVWTLMHALNALRNTLGHRLRSEERDRRMTRVHRTWLKVHGTLENEPPDAFVVQAACTHCLAFLTALSNDE
ncbi:MAG: hypothetical protein QOD26_3832 [Betaproteobacteria bacterium]|jgi:hypothetical protein|nr:hypothetical protein [Betaproteobacteria bacterium]